ncbi:MAG TPA: TlpA disulfide reductase family protein [Parasegetibacter sp.]|jgi:thiol-disulfide isomerase/thioredoxin/uncharacterized protein YlbG (UPF0298 family)
MKVFSFLAALIISITSFANDTGIVINIKFNGSKDNIRMEVGKESMIVKPDESGNARVLLDIKFPQYVKLHRSTRPELLFLFPGDQLDVSITGAAIGRLEFSGKHAAINKYLSDPNSVQAGGGFNLDEAEYLDFMRNKVKNAVERLEKMGFEKEFTEMEKKRIASKVYTSLVTYPNLRKRTERTYHPSDNYFSFVKEVLFEDAGMLLLNEYTDFIQYLYQMLGTKDIRVYDAFNYAESTLKYVVNHVKDEQVKKHLVNFYAYDYLKRHGIEKAEPITAIFRKHVDNASQIKLYDETIKKWQNVTPGKVMTDFTFYDIDGKAVPISAFRGKYVYIDVWATWCVPCIAEIPNLKKLEEELTGKNITFISISVDKDAEAWKKMLIEDKFTGVQLHARGREFSNELLIVSIPRFILLDPEGRIIEANATRPGRPETLEKMKSLPGI